MDAAKAELMARLKAAADCMAARMRTPQMEEWAEIDLTLPQLRALGYLGERAQRMGDIAAFLGSSVSSATSLIERLVAKGLIARSQDPDDRRVVLCQLTATGRATIERVWRMQRMRLELFAEVLTVEELAQLVAALEVLSSALARHNAPETSAPEAAADIPAEELATATA